MDHKERGSACTSALTNAGLFDLFGEHAKARQFAEQALELFEGDLSLFFARANLPELDGLIAAFADELAEDASAKLLYARAVALRLRAIAAARP